MFDRHLLRKLQRPMEALGLEVELVRRSDLVDVGAGLVNLGLERRRLRTLSARSVVRGRRPRLRLAQA